ncbi:MAG: hypothetical protein A3J27_05560 [Candidatus Tectomicrobia bacterium RIFCSPLOWO2_12_FULL_69_37]|nr:MAG: hypothetical protein A3J27_05560 [Candidatus Tectomicrobia bacterium RIFCSPLOWO2_12_FULL_69_37]
MRGLEIRGSLSVVIPCHNEEGNVDALWAELRPVLAGLGRDWEVIFVNDASTDGTLARLRALERDNPGVRVVEHARNLGESAAQLSGFAAARGEIVATMDADLQNDPADLPRLIGALGETAGAACGVRPRRADTRLKQFSTWAANGFRNWVLKDGILDAGCTYRVFRRKALAQLIPFRGLHRFLPTILQTHGWEVRQIEVADRPRKAGASKYGLGNRVFVGLIDTLAVLWYQRRHIPPPPG